MGKDKRELRWLRLDNAAKIYPAARRQSWSNVFRLSVSLTEPVDKAVLQQALDVTVRRFPSLAARLRKGVFWYYLQQVEQAPRLQEEYCYPLAMMDKAETRRCALRVIAWENRIAVEFFHCLTDGNGGQVFLKTLTAEYLQQKYGVQIPCTHGVLDRRQQPAEEELEDSFLKYAGTVHASRKEPDAWHTSGTPSDTLHLTAFSLSVQAVLDKSHELGVSCNTYLTAAMMLALLRLQQEKVPAVRKQKPIRVLVPVNLRKLFPSRTLRNFVLFVIPQIDPRLGDYTFEEICKAVHHFMGAEVNAKRMSRVIATNVADESSLIIKLMPLFIKNFVMRMVFDAVGERKSCLTMSNLGAAQMPREMAEYVTAMDFILSPQASAPHNCGVISWNGQLHINFIRNIEEAELELAFFRVLQELGLEVCVQSNG